MLNFRSKRSEETVDSAGALLGRDGIRDVVDMLAEDILGLLRFVDGVIQQEFDVNEVGLTLHQRSVFRIGQGAECVVDGHDKVGLVSEGREFVICTSPNNKER